MCEMATECRTFYCYWFVYVLKRVNFLVLINSFVILGGHDVLLWDMRRTREPVCELYKCTNNVTVNW
jgi:hypothetical protein